MKDEIAGEYIYTLYFAIICYKRQVKTRLSLQFIGNERSYLNLITVVYFSITFS